MNHADHVDLLRDGVRGTTWADLGSGGGAFTLALADLIGPSGTIYSVDKDQGALREQQATMRARFPGVAVHYQQADFTKPLLLAGSDGLDGIVMANSLHFVRHKEPVLQQIRRYLRPGGRLILVEYNADQGNMWVPHPMTYETWEKLAQRVGFETTRLLATKPSRFLREIYSAVSV
jgi:ubiquinone/menaquinone biosynthesis C-methylase UbiE